jgi:hypothetical protein
MKERIDCLALKDRIHAALREEDAGLTDEEIRRRTREELEHSDSIIARKWRSIKAARQNAAADPEARS